MIGYAGEDPGDPVLVPAGTIVAFSSFTLHRSGGNTTGRPRRSYFMAFTPALFPYADPARGEVYSPAAVPFLRGGRPLDPPSRAPQK
jgi:ectoine hydroxylase-related dioxygenase (phytanoyl-CoA dioxygenase family)